MDQNEILADIRERVVRVETKINTMHDTDKIANAALTSSKSAHKRIDKIDKTIFWLATTLIGAVITGIVAIVFQGVN
ncbi:hemolysin XhlA family protein [Amphibacillus sp. Q70]|uniref:hemolysin XhlA family protein n=1 Tax=Amphibacillus sp. Q70 TaxID=3453416 RepID=UPI003F875324